jgi:hypothetical protein
MNLRIDCVHFYRSAIRLVFILQSLCFQYYCNLILNIILDYLENLNSSCYFTKVFKNQKLYVLPKACISVFLYRSQSKRR